MDFAEELKTAQSLDQQDELRHFREQFIIPTIGDVTRETLAKDASNSDPKDDKPSTYLCGNSLGLQPRAVSKYVQAQLDTWAQRGVFGHFMPAPDAIMPPWLHLDDVVRKPMSKLVGASEAEVVLMQTLTANLHFLMTSFYKPTKDHYRIIIETKAFPSDHYAVESQLMVHGYDPADAMVLIEPPEPSSPLIPTDHILSIIDKHADTAAVLLLPGIQFYTGQLFDIPKITAYAQSKGIVAGWDLAHAVGNVPLQLHDWSVDFAAWCTYKYMNCGPGAMGGLFVHERHTDIRPLKPRLTGWWGSSKSSRFQMNNRFDVLPGAGGFQVSNPSALDLSAIVASLSVFEQTSIDALRRKSLSITAYLQSLLLALPEPRGFSIITPLDPSQRGAQLSLLLDPGLLDGVLHLLELGGVVIDERKPDVIRVAPAPLYNRYEDVCEFVRIFSEAVRRARTEDVKGGNVAAHGGNGEKGWSEIK